MPQPDDRYGPSPEGVSISPSFLNTGVALGGSFVSALENHVTSFWPPCSLSHYFKVFLSSGLRSLTMMCLDLHFFGYPVWNLLSFLNLFFIECEKFSTINFSSIFFSSPPFSYPWDTHVTNVRSSVIFAEVPEALFLISVYFLFFRLGNFCCSLFGSVVFFLVPPPPSCC